MAALPLTGTVISADGIQGRFEAEPPGKDEANPRVWIKFADGRQVWVAAKELIPQAEGHYLLPLPLAAQEGGETQVIPVIAEFLNVAKRSVETGGVRVSKKVEEHEEVIDEPLLHEDVEVQRVAVNRFVEAPMPVRQEDATVIIPLFEEVLVIEKRLLLKEEVHIQRRQTTLRQPQTVTRRSETVVVERLEHSGPPREENPSSLEGK
ncbi:MAG TPA: YsnF/AvaK domain-containing protein [Candidatus Competibacteraceae bacterium]|nr:YsnF/AvaK domain-containing protein [Candidatus Competibacteraceae bacterium]